VEEAATLGATVRGTDLPYNLYNDPIPEGVGETSPFNVEIVTAQVASMLAQDKAREEKK